MGKRASRQSISHSWLFPILQVSIQNSWLRRISQGTYRAPGPENYWPSLLTLWHSLVSEMFVWKQFFPWLWLPLALRTKCPTKPSTFCVVLSCVPNPRSVPATRTCSIECLRSEAHTLWSASDSTDPDPQCRNSEAEWRFKKKKKILDPVFGYQLWSWKHQICTQDSCSHHWT